jgi:hypothetical protein
VVPDTRGAISRSAHDERVRWEEGAVGLSDWVYDLDGSLKQE